MEIDSSPNLISNVVMNNTNNNGEPSEANQLSQSVSEQLEQDTFASLKNTKNLSHDETFNTFSDSSQNRVIDDSNATSSGNDNEYPNPQIEFCFYSNENFSSPSPNKNSDNIWNGAYPYAGAYRHAELIGTEAYGYRAYPHTGLIGTGAYGYSLGSYGGLYTFSYPIIDNSGSDVTKQIQYR